MQNTPNRSPEEQTLYGAVDSILILAGIDGKSVQINRGIVTENNLNSWPFFDGFHSEKEAAGVKGERVYHIILDTGEQVLVSYEKISLEGFKCISISSLKQKPGVGEILGKIKETEEKTRNSRGIDIVARDRVHELI